MFQSRSVVLSTFGIQVLSQYFLAVAHIVDQEVLYASHLENQFFLDVRFTFELRSAVWSTLGS